MKIIVSISISSQKYAFSLKTYFGVGSKGSLGDARKVSNIMYAIWDAHEVANHM